MNIPLKSNILIILSFLFPQILKETFDMIGYCDNKHPDIACWKKSGTQFIVKNPEDLGNNIIPQYFEHNNYSSFFRQLNFYKFKKETLLNNASSLDTNITSPRHLVYEHKYFRKDRADLLPRIKRSTCGNKSRDLEGDIIHIQEDINSLKDKASFMVRDFSQKIDSFSSSIDRKLSELHSVLKEQKEIGNRSPSRKRHCPGANTMSVGDLIIEPLPSNNISRQRSIDFILDLLRETPNSQEGPSAEKKKNLDPWFDSLPSKGIERNESTACEIDIDMLEFYCIDDHCPTPRKKRKISLGFKSSNTIKQDEHWRIPERFELTRELSILSDGKNIVLQLE